MGSRFIYIGPSYDHSGGVLLGSMNELVLYPHLMTDADVLALLIENPKLTRYWNDTQSGTGTSSGSGTGTGGGGSNLDWLTPMLLDSDSKTHFDRTTGFFIF